MTDATMRHNLTLTHPLNLQSNLFDEAGTQRLSEGVVLLRSEAPTADWMSEIDRITAQAALRNLVVPGGKTMSVAMTNCGALGLVSDASGYRYADRDPLTGLAWPQMPDSFARMAAQWAALAGFSGFAPDACLINRYGPGARMGLHQDRDEKDFGQPIVSVSLGASAIFLLGGLTRRAAVQKLALHSGDVLIWGGPDRLRFHGVQRLATQGASGHEGTGIRYNLTFRKAG